MQTQSDPVVRIALRRWRCCALALSACAGGSVQQALGMGKRSPDEFAVVSRAPLIMPPEFDLRPPEPGARGPQVGTTGPGAGHRCSASLSVRSPAWTDQSIGTTARPRSACGERRPAGVAGEGERRRVDPDIRSEIAEENQSLGAVEGELFTRFLKWREPMKLGATVDAPAEAQRLHGEPGRGQPATAGDTPTVVERRQSPLGALVEKVF